MSRNDALATGEKKRDYWFTVLLTDPVAVPFTRFLARHRSLSPDAVSAIALLLGLSVGALFALGTRTGLVLGGITFYLAFVFDCVDGKLARALDVTSPRGEALDRLADGGRRASASLGLAAYLWRAEGVSDVTVWWAITYAIAAYYFLEISGAERTGGDVGPGARLSAMLARRRLLPNPGMPDVQAVVFIFGPLTGLVVLALGVGIGMVAAAILLTLWRRLR
ncbi:MAG: CDP-alcohol phosphatidyltransferase family protein [Actinomycetota bacterium]